MRETGVKMRWGERRGLIVFPSLDDRAGAAGVDVAVAYKLIHPWASAESLDERK